MSRLSWRFGALCAAAIATSAPLIAQGQGAAPRAGVRAPEKPLPLEAGRTFSLDTREGTWLSLDVSPDGTTIASTKALVLPRVQAPKVKPAQPSAVTG